MNITSTTFLPLKVRKATYFLCASASSSANWGEKKSPTSVAVVRNKWDLDLHKFLITVGSSCISCLDNCSVWWFKGFRGNNTILLSWFKTRSLSQYNSSQHICLRETQLWMDTSIFSVIPTWCPQQAAQEQQWICCFVNKRSSRTLEPSLGTIQCWESHEIHS